MQNITEETTFEELINIAKQRDLDADKWRHKQVAEHKRNLFILDETTDDELRDEFVAECNDLIDDEMCNIEESEVKINTAKRLLTESNDFANDDYKISVINNLNFMIDMEENNIHYANQIILSYIEAIENFDVFKNRKSRKNQIESFIASFE